MLPDVPVPPAPAPPPADPAAPPAPPAPPPACAAQFSIVQAANKPANAIVPMSVLIASFLVNDFVFDVLLLHPLCSGRESQMGTRPHGLIPGLYEIRHPVALKGEGAKRAEIRARGSNVLSGWGRLVQRVGLVEPRTECWSDGVLGFQHSCPPHVAAPRRAQSDAPCPGQPARAPAGNARGGRAPRATTASFGYGCCSRKNRRPVGLTTFK